MNFAKLVQPISYNAWAATLFASVFVTAFLATPHVHAHEGHDHGAELAETAAPEAVVQLSETAKRNLGLKTAEAEVRAIEKTLPVTGVIRPILRNRKVVSAPATGSIAALKVDLGRKVRSGDTLALLEARQISAAPVRIAIRAPRSGQIIRLEAIAGASVETGMALMEIADYSEVIAAVGVFETDASQLRPGLVAHIRPAGMASARVSGKVEYVAPEVDAQTRRVEAWVKINNAQGLFKINMSVAADIVVGAGEEVIAVPREAVLRKGGIPFVYVVTEEGFAKTPVVLGQGDDRYLEIIEGIGPGEEVVVQGNYQLQFVRPAPTSPTQPSPSSPAASKDK